MSVMQTRRRIGSDANSWDPFVVVTKVAAVDFWDLRQSSAARCADSFLAHVHLNEKDQGF
jgi:hypothetical protein